MSRILTTALLLVMAQHAAAVSDVFTYQGSLTDAGLPASGSYDLRFELTGPGPAVTPIVLEDVAVSGGVFSVDLDFGAVITGGNFSLLIGVRPGSSSGAFTSLSPATPIRPAPQAQVAGIASEAVTVSPNAVGTSGIQDGSVGGADINAAQVQARVTGSCAAGNAIRTVAADGSVTCQAAGGGSVTSVATGAGLSGGPITSTGTIAIASSGVNSGMVLDGSISGTDIDDSQVQRRVSGTCSAGSSIRAISSSGVVTCDTVVQSQDWTLLGNSGTNPASHFIGTIDAQPFVVRTQNVQALRIEPSTNLFFGSPNTANVIMGSQSNSVDAGVRGAAVLGGGAQVGSEGLLANAAPNRATDSYSLAAGGYGNQAGNGAGSSDDTAFATVVGGTGNRAAALRASVFGGGLNSALGVNDTVLGGVANIVGAGDGVIAGGSVNTVTGAAGAVVGGTGNCAGGAYSFVAGSNAWSRPANGTTTGGCEAVTASGDNNGDEGTFIWADRSSTAGFMSSGANQFLVRADGGFMLNASTLPASGDDLVLGARKIGGDSDADLRLLTRSGKSALLFLKDSNGGLSVTYGALTAGADRLSVGGGTGGNATLSNGGAWTNASSRTFKQGFMAVDSREVLERVVDLPITRWTYNGSSEGTHMGPMAEDFKAAFALAGNGTSIATVDADGVALAAIQGLNQKLEAENAQLRQRLDRLEARLGGQ